MEPNTFLPVGGSSVSQPLSRTPGSPAPVAKKHLSLWVSIAAIIVMIAVAGLAIFLFVSERGKSLNENVVSPQFAPQTSQAAQDSVLGTLGAEIYAEAANPAAENIPETNPIKEAEVNPYASGYVNPFQ